MNTPSSTRRKATAQGTVVTPKSSAGEGNLAEKISLGDHYSIDSMPISSTRAPHPHVVDSSTTDVYGYIIYPKLGTVYGHEIYPPFTEVQPAAVVVPPPPPVHHPSPLVIRRVPTSSNASAFLPRSPVQPNFNDVTAIERVARAFSPTPESPKDQFASTSSSATATKKLRKTKQVNKTRTKHPTKLATDYPNLELKKRSLWNKKVQSHKILWHPGLGAVIDILDGHCRIIGRLEALQFGNIRSEKSGGHTEQEDPWMALLHFVLDFSAHERETRFSYVRFECKFSCKAEDGDVSIADLAKSVEDGEAIPVAVKNNLHFEAGADATPLGIPLNVSGSIDREVSQTRLTRFHADASGRGTNIAVFSMEENSSQRDGVLKSIDATVLVNAPRKNPFTVELSIQHKIKGKVISLFRRSNKKSNKNITLSFDGKQVKGKLPSGFRVVSAAQVGENWAEKNGAHQSKDMAALPDVTFPEPSDQEEIVLAEPVNQENDTDNRQETEEHNVRQRPLHEVSAIKKNNEEVVRTYSILNLLVAVINVVLSTLGTLSGIFAWLLAPQRQLKPEVSQIVESRVDEGGMLSPNGGL